MERKFRKVVREEREQHTIVLRYPAIYKAEQYNVDKHAFDNNFDFYDIDSELSWKVQGLIEDEKVDLAEFVNHDLFGDIVSIKLGFDVDKDELVVTCILYPGTDPNDILDDLKEFLAGQITDGWGEGFEQQELMSKTYYIVCNENDDSDIYIYENWREAEREEERMNDEIEQQMEDEDGDPEDYDHYNSINTEVTFYCSFYYYKNNVPEVNPSSVEIDGNKLNEAFSYNKTNYNSWFKNPRELSARWFGKWRDAKDEDNKRSSQSCIFAEKLRECLPKFKYCKDIEDMIDILRDAMSDMDSGQARERFDVIIKDLETFDHHNPYDFRKVMSMFGHLSKRGIAQEYFSSEEEYEPQNYGETGDEVVDNEFLRKYRM